MLIPVADPTIAHLDVPIGYGGTEAPLDYQRGTLVYRLTDGIGGPWHLENSQPVDLVTRVTALVTPSRRAAGGVSGSGQTVVSLVDVPLTAPQGTWGLEILIDDGTSLTALPAQHQFQSEIEILATQGVPTPLEGWEWAFGSGWLDATNDIPKLVPRPGVAISANRSCPANPCAGGPIASLEFELSYPPAVIDLAEVVPIDFDADFVTWLQDDDVNGVVQVGAIAPTGRISSGIEGLLLLFTLDDGASQTLDLATDISIDPASIKAHDKDGIDVTTEWDITVTADKVL